MSQKIDEQPTMAPRTLSWLQHLLRDPVAALMESALWVFLLSIGV
jgi:hypothetical protein